MIPNTRVVLSRYFSFSLFVFLTILPCSSTNSPYQSLCSFISNNLIANFSVSRFGAGAFTGAGAFAVGVEAFTDGAFAIGAGAFTSSEFSVGAGAFAVGAGASTDGAGAFANGAFAVSAGAFAVGAGAFTNGAEAFANGAFESSDV